MAYISKRNRKKEKDRQIAANNRRELIAAGFKRRDLLKMGLLTSAGMLIPKKGLSAHPITSAGLAFDDPQSPPTTPFVDNMPRLTVLAPVASLTPAPTIAPNTAASEDASLRISKNPKRSATNNFTPATATICFGRGTNSVSRKNGENGADCAFARSG